MKDERKEVNWVALIDEDPAYFEEVVRCNGRPPRDISAYCALVIEGRCGRKYGVFHLEDKEIVEVIAALGMIAEVAWASKEFYQHFPYLAPAVRAA